MSGHLGRELGRSYPFPVQSLNMPAVATLEAMGGFLPESFSGASSGQGLGFRPDYGPQGAMMEPYPNGAEATRRIFHAGGDAWGHHPGPMMGPYMVPQPVEVSPPPRQDIKEERDFEQPRSYNGHHWVSSRLEPSAGAHSTPGNSGESTSPRNEPQSSSSPGSQLVELNSTDSSPQSIESGSPGGSQPTGVKQEGSSEDEPQPSCSYTVSSSLGACGTDDKEDVPTAAELEKFATLLKHKRITMGFTQAEVGSSLGVLFGKMFSQTTICRFEAMQLSFKNMCKLKPLLQRWVTAAENENLQEQLSAMDSAELQAQKRRRTSIENSARDILEYYFSQCPKPEALVINRIAEDLKLERDVVRVWFCNRRQKDKRSPGCSSQDANGSPPLLPPLSSGLLPPPMSGFSPAHPELPPPPLGFNSAPFAGRCLPPFREGEPFVSSTSSPAVMGHPMHSS